MSKSASSLNKHLGWLLLIAAVILLAYFGRLAIVAKDTPALATPQVTDDRVPPPVLGIETFPKSIIQGEPVLVVINGISHVSEVASLTFNSKPLWLFTYESKPSALIGLDLRMEPATYPLVLTLVDGRTIETSITVGKRKLAVEQFDIPDKLGGNTSESQKTLVSSLVEEAAIINSIPTADTFLWSGKFRMPLDEPVTVLDPYGYTRQTGATSLSHKGTDFRAAIGTPVYAMNSGVVRYNGFLRNYGNAIVLDHGHGLQTVYMHLSRSDVTLGETVEKGHVIGLSGDTGYVLGPHLHLSIRIGKVSIDPMRFMELFGV